MLPLEYDGLGRRFVLSCGTNLEVTTTTLAFPCKSHGARCEVHVDGITQPITTAIDARRSQAESIALQLEHRAADHCLARGSTLCWKIVPIHTPIEDGELLPATYVEFGGGAVSQFDLRALVAKDRFSEVARVVAYMFRLVLSRIRS